MSEHHTAWDVLYMMASNLPAFVAAGAAFVAAWKGVTNAAKLNSHTTAIEGIKADVIEVKNQTNGMGQALQASARTEGHAAGMVDEKAREKALTPLERHEEIRGQQ